MNNGMIGFVDNLNLMLQQVQDKTLSTATISAVNGRYRLVIGMPQEKDMYMPRIEMPPMQQNMPTTTAKSGCTSCGDDSTVQYKTAYSQSYTEDIDMWRGVPGTYPYTGKSYKNRETVKYSDSTMPGKSTGDIGGPMHGGQTGGVSCDESGIAYMIKYQEHLINGI